MFDSITNWLDGFIDDLPTEAVFRGSFINIRVGEAPQTRQMLAAGVIRQQAPEALIKASDCGEEAPRNGETLSIGATVYKIASVTPLVSIVTPIGYRVILVTVV
jgi:hypothetical protein